MIAWMTGWKPAWPAMTAFSMVSSDSSWASNSTIRTASAVPATTRSRVEVLHLLDRRVEPDLALDDADARRADRPHERHAGKGERRGRGDHRQDVRIRLEVIGEHRGDDLGLAAEFVGKQRADRTIDQARSERLAVRGASLALQVAARNAAGGERLLLIMDGEGEEVLPGLGLLERDDRREHGGFAPGGEHGAVGLTRHRGRSPARACARTSRVLHVECQTSFFILRLRMRKPAARMRAVQARHRQDGGGLGEPKRQPSAILP